MKTYNYNWIEFLSGRNVIKVTNEKEFNIFKEFLEKYGLVEILNDTNTYSEWQHLATINRKNENLFLFEYNNYKGLTWWDNIQEATDYYGESPIEVSELQKLFNTKSIDKSIKNETKRLCDLVDIETNNKECVVLKIKENSSLDLIKLGYFEGDEKAIRVTKGKNHTYTIFTKNNNYSWEHGEKGYTIVSDNTDRKRMLINDCIENDFDIYIGGNKDLVEKSLSIHCIEDTYKNENYIEIMYWENKQNERVVVHKNGELFRAFSSKGEAKKFFKDTGYVLSYSDDYVANTGCIVEEYKLVKEQYLNLKREEINQKKDSDFDYDY